MISVCCPTRGRPDNMRRLVDSANITAEGIIEIVFYIDEDDDSDSIQALALLAEEHKTTGSPGVIGPRITLSECWNRCAEQATGDILMHCGDDITFHTPGWDIMVEAEFAATPDKILFVYGDDGIQGPSLGTHGFVSRRWVDTLGYLCPPYFVSDYNDVWLTEVARTIGRDRYLPGLNTEHHHPSAGKAEWDQTHLERLARHRASNPGRLYQQLAPERAADAAKLQAIIDEGTS